MMKNILLASSLTLFSVASLNATVLSSSQVIENAQKNIKSLNTDEVVKILKENPNTKVIDVRTRGDILKQGGFIKANKVINIPRDKMEFIIGNEVNENEKFIVHCYTGNISLLAVKQLHEMGYKGAMHYKDSYKGWSEAGLKTSSLDKYPESILYDKVKKVADGVYTSIGQTSPSTYENVGHNNNLGFVIGNDSVAVWNAGGTYLLAKALHDEIKKITDKPIKYVVIENSQGHAMAGSSYWKSIGATIVGQEIAKKEIERKIAKGSIKKLQNRFKDKAIGTEFIVPDVTFKDNYKMDLGGKIVEAKYFGYAHEHSDICLWIPDQKIVFAGDIAFNQRILPIFEITETLKWLEAWDKFAALEANIVIPGHGDVTDMPTVTWHTKGYIEYLREKILEVIDNDGGLNEAYEIDMSPYEHLDTFKELGKQNVSRLFKQLEFE
jgi:glyoxylase-like metal-dependent hydrolase (beta-lactamase superfamily II)/rhodanese-related sulfurtransferase